MVATFGILAAISILLLIKTVISYIKRAPETLALGIAATALSVFSFILYITRLYSR